MQQVLFALNLPFSVVLLPKKLLNLLESIVHLSNGFTMIFLKRFLQEK